MLFPVLEIAVFELAMVYSPMFIVGKQHIYRLSIKTSGLVKIRHAAGAAECRLYLQLIHTVFLAVLYFK